MAAAGNKKFIQWDEREESGQLRFYNIGDDEALRKVDPTIRQHNAQKSLAASQGRPVLLMTFNIGCKNLNSETSPVDKGHIRKFGTAFLGTFAKLLFTLE